MLIFHIEIVDLPIKNSGFSSSLCNSLHQFTRPGNPRWIQRSPMDPDGSQASNIGTEHFVGQAGAAAEGGVSVAMYEWSAGWGKPIQEDQ